MSMKNSNDTIKNRTHDFPACSAVPQPTAPPHALFLPCQKFSENFENKTITKENIPKLGECVCMHCSLSVSLVLV